ncbi:MAG: SPOR domain-containing protein [Bacteroidia bacterium]|nr:SPOR domain-containing protein [Bacteroidia bacterium]
MDITFYLVELLRLHDCVIVPELGGFVTNYRPAEMDLANNSFNPPVKEIIFTSKLSKNDGLLVNYISETEGVGYFEARQIISEFVDEIWSKLENGEKIEFQNVGSLQFDRNEKLIFEPEVHENFLLEAYGMEDFQFPLLEHKEIIPSKRIFADKEAVRPVLSSRKVKVLIGVGVPIILALIFVPVSYYPWKNNPNTQVSSTTSIPMNGLIAPANTANSDSVNNYKLAVKVDSAAIHQPSVSQTQTETVAFRSDARYRVIGGCFRIRENADNFLAKLQASGFKSELKVQPNGSFLVIVQSYSDKNEAITALRTLREAEPQIGYWMSVN